MADDVAPINVSGVRDWAASQGYNVPEGFSDADILNTFHEGWRNPQIDPRITQLATAGREYTEFQNSDDWKQYQTWKKDQKPSAPAEPKGYEPPAWEVPEAVDDSEVLIVDPQTGQPTINPNASYAAIQKYKNYQKWQTTQAQKMLREFPSLVRAYAKAEIEDFKKSLPQQFGTHINKTLSDQRTQAYLTQNAQDIFEIDQFGNPVIDPYTGKEKLQPLGQLLQYHANQARALIGKGPDDPLNETEAVTVQRYAQQNAERDMTLAYAPYYLQQQQQAAANGQQNGNGRPPVPNGQANGTPARGPDGKFLPQETSTERNERQKKTFEQGRRQQRTENPGENHEATPRNEGAKNRRPQKFEELLEKNARKQGLAP